MADQLSEVIKTLSEIKNSLNYQWIEKTSYVLIGGVISTLSIYLTNRYSLKKEEKMFLLKKQTDELIYKSKLAGEIKAAGYEVKLFIAHFLRNEFHYSYEHKAYSLGPLPADKMQKIRAEIEKLEKTAISYGDGLGKTKMEFLKLIGEYRYFIREENLDELVNNFFNSPIALEANFHAMTSDEFLKCVQKEYYKIYVTDKIALHYKRVDAILEYIFKHKL